MQAWARGKGKARRKEGGARCRRESRDGGLASQFPCVSVRPGPGLGGGGFSTSQRGPLSFMLSLLSSHQPHTPPYSRYMGGDGHHPHLVFEAPFNKIFVGVLVWGGVGTGAGLIVVRTYWGFACLHESRSSRRTHASPPPPPPATPQTTGLLEVPEQEAGFHQVSECAGGEDGQALSPPGRRKKKRHVCKREEARKTCVPSKERSNQTQNRRDARSVVTIASQKGHFFFFAFLWWVFFLLCPSLHVPRGWLPSARPRPRQWPVSVPPLPAVAASWTRAPACGVGLPPPL